MLYFEDFMEDIEDLPYEFKENLTAIRQLDLQVQNIMEPLESRLNEFFQKCSQNSISSSQQTQEYEKILKEFDEVESKSVDKILITDQMKDTFNKMIKRKLDTELNKFKLELEADNPGSAEAIELMVNQHIKSGVTDGIQRVERKRIKRGRIGFDMNNCSQMHRIDLAQKELKRMLREIGETVTLTCRVEDVSELSVTFRHGTNKAENGISHFAAYVTSKVPVNKHILHLLKITKLQWDDHGLWECMQGGTAWNATIDITVQSSIEPLRASLAPLAAASSDQLRSGAVAIGNEDGEVTPHLLYGKGIRTNPFNLTGGARITLECVTGCSFPATRHRSVFSNHSTAPEVIIDASSTTVIGSCSVPNEVSGMVTRSSVLLSCASFPSLVGSNEVSCSMVEDSSCRRPDCVAATRHIPVTFPSVLLLPRSMQCSLS